MSSNVGNSAIYENGDQKNPPRSEINNAEPYHEGKENSHNTNDSKDQASLKNNLARAEHDHKKADYKSPETIQLQQDPTKPVSCSQQYGSCAWHPMSIPDNIPTPAGPDARQRAFEGRQDRCRDQG